MNFASDNTTGASPEILEALIKANSGSTMPYGNDQYTTLATQMIQELFAIGIAILTKTSVELLNFLPEAQN